MPAFFFAPPQAKIARNKIIIQSPEAPASGNTCSPFERANTPTKMDNLPPYVQNVRTWFQLSIEAQKAMREKFVYAALALVICGAIYLVTQGMNLLNQPSDLKVAGGVGLIVAVILLFPAAMKWIWHHKTTPHNQLNQ